MGYLIDSDVLIAAERDQFSLPGLLEPLADDPLALAAVTASELLHGIHRATSPDVRERRRRFVEYVLTIFPIVSFDLEVARVHARLWATLQGQGQVLGSHDLMIAATALALDYGLITGNRAEFGRVPGLRVVNPL